MTEMVPADRIVRSADPLPRLPRVDDGPALRSVESAAAPGVATAPPAPRKLPVRRLLGLVALCAALGAAGYFGYRYWTEGRFMVSTDDAYVKADMATIAAKVSGYVQSVAVVENQVVKKGDILAQIDPVDYNLAVAAAKGRIETQGATIARLAAQADVQRSTIDQARASLAAAEADRVRAAAEFQRASDLMQHNFGTAQRIDQTRADRDRTAASVTSAKAQVAAAEANLAVINAQRTEAERTRDELGVALERAQRDLDFATVRAPFDGVIGNKAIQPGQYVQPGTRLLTLVPPQTAYVEANYKETQIGRLRPGQRALVRIDAHSSRAIEGTVESFAPASGAQFSMLPPENATGNFTKIVQRLPVRIKVPVEVAREGILAPGLSVVVDVDTRTGPQTGDRTAANAAAR